MLKYPRSWARFSRLSSENWPRSKKVPSAGTEGTRESCTISLASTCCPLTAIKSDVVHLDLASSLTSQCSSIAVMAVRWHQTCVTSAHAKLGGKFHNVSRNRARTQVLLQAQNLHAYGSGTFGAFEYYRGVLLGSTSLGFQVLTLQMGCSKVVHGMSASSRLMKYTSYNRLLHMQTDRSVCLASEGVSAADLKSSGWNTTNPISVLRFWISEGLTQSES